MANCNDSGPGSLRNAVALASSGDTLDLRSLRCTITLTRGEIQVPQESLALLGPGAGALTITSRGTSRILLHAGTGTLSIRRLSIVEGVHAAQSANGGCIRSAGSVELRHARVRQCIAEGVRPPDCEGTPCSSAIGGAISARGAVRMYYSTVSDSAVYSFDSYGGGIIGGHLTMYRSRLLGNSGNFSGGAHVSRFTAIGSIIARNASYYGGAVHVGPTGGGSPTGTADVRDSTFTMNQTEEGDCAALCAGDATVVNSTFSRNDGGLYGGAIEASQGSIFNSTIVLNRSIDCGGAVRADTLYLESTIVARNPCGTGVMDINDVRSLMGAHNLVGVSGIALPAGTLRADPLLGPLADNGGPTPTHALRAGSPAINRGSNPLDLPSDQRGPGFPRVKGGCADVGAFER